MSAEKKPAKLPETPFNGVVVSVDKTTFNENLTFLNLAITADSGDPEKPIIVFYGSKVRLIDPRVHIRPGHTIRVKRVILWRDSGLNRSTESYSATEEMFSEPVLAATDIEFDLNNLWQRPQKIGDENV